MCRNQGITFKVASKESEFSQIHKLNYETFVKEIPQHKKNDSDSLVDKFHDQNTYIICLNDRELIGMIAVRDKRPFSLDCKLKDLDNFLPESNSICEIRLLSIKKNYRNKKILSGLFTSLAKYCEENGFDLALISATVRELNLYKKLGFTEFGGLVGEKKAQYQPMYLTFNSYKSFRDKTKILKIGNKEINFLPGPVTISDEVKKAFELPLVSHRSKEFLSDFNETKKLLCNLNSAENVEILMGSGTLANDVVAAQISLLKGKGLVLSNGHFGKRLIDQAERFSLDFDVLTADWGKPFDYDEVKKIVEDNKSKWLWFVHCETSTGVLNNLSKLKAISKEFSLKLCLDCVSSIGTYSFSLEDIYLASGVSGKALCSYPGLSFVFYNHDLSSNNILPRYLDLAFYKNSNGVPFTISSNLLYALKKSIEITDVESVYQSNKELMHFLRENLSQLNIEILSPIDHSSSSYLSFRLPFKWHSKSIGEELEKKGFLLNYRSKYLIENNILQIALLGQKQKKNIEKLFLALKKVL